MGVLGGKIVPSGMGVLGGKIVPGGDSILLVGGSSIELRG